MLIIENIKLTLDQNEDELINKISKRLNIKQNDIKIIEISSKSLDCRSDILFIYSVIIEIKNEDRYLKIKDVKKYTPITFNFKQYKLNSRPIIIGYGPAGLFCAYRFLLSGITPIVFEKGKRIDKRAIDVSNLFNNGVLDEKSNVAFGEAGAGAFSDAKLTSRSNDINSKFIKQTFIKFGADPKILYEKYPHIGTDNIQKVIKNMTNYMIKSGVEFHFESEVNDFLIENNQIKAVISNNIKYYSDIVVLAIGHSSYDVLYKLNDLNVHLEKKDFSIGFRIEHPQDLIDDNQYHHIKHIKLEPSQYFLTYNDNYGVYSFCMCPGGIVIPSMAKSNTLVTNGMSYSKRDSNFANSAILIQVKKNSLPNDLFSGCKYIEDLEQKAFNISKSYKCLTQNANDYINNTISPLIRCTTYPLGNYICDINHIFTNEQNMYFKNALKHFNTKIKGFIERGIIMAPETRTSSPIRIVRDKNDYCSISTKGLYPIGEGAGYGGGIISCALDGINCSEAILKFHKNFN